MYDTGYPWLTGGAVKFLMKYLNKDMGVLEFGCGASTVWMSKRVAWITAVDNSQAWTIETEKKIQYPNYIMCRKRPYNNIFVNATLKVDFILVDGRDRVECFRSEYHTLKPGGVIMLDNSERPEYKECFDMVKDWKMEWSAGPDYTGTWTYDGWVTTWWTKNK